MAGRPSMAPIRKRCNVVPCLQGVPATRCAANLANGQCTTAGAYRERTQQLRRSLHVPSFVGKWRCLYHCYRRIAGTSPQCHCGLIPYPYWSIAWQHPSRAHQEITASIQSPSGINNNHPEPIRKKQQPSTAHHEITATIQSTPAIHSNHPEPIRNKEQPSRAHQE